MLLSMILWFALAVITVVVVGCIILAAWPILLILSEIAIFVFIIVSIIKAIFRRNRKN